MNINQKDSEALTTVIAKWMRNTGRLKKIGGHTLIFHLEVTGAGATKLLIHHELYEVPKLPELDLSMSFLEFCEENNISTRVKNSLREGNCYLGDRTPPIKTVRDLLKLTERQLLLYPNFGRKSLVEIKDVFTKYGITPE